MRISSANETAEILSSDIAYQEYPGQCYINTVPDMYVNRGPFWYHQTVVVNQEKLIENSYILDNYLFKIWTVWVYIAVDTKFGLVALWGRLIRLLPISLGGLSCIQRPVRHQLASVLPGPGHSVPLISSGVGVTWRKGLFYAGSLQQSPTTS